MIDEGLLKAAAAELSLCQLESLPDVVDEPHVFSRKFQRRMKRMIFVTDHPYQRMLCNVAAVFIAVVMAIAAFLSICPDVRATVVEWICSISGSMVQYRCGERTVTDVPEYALSQVPKGYTLYEEFPHDGGNTYVYCDDSGRVLSFTYTNGKSASDLCFYITEFEHSKVFVDDTSADLYMSSVNRECNYIVWEDPDNGVLFAIGHQGSQSDLLALAESVDVK